MATYNKFHPFIEACCEKKHDLSSDTIKVALCNEANAPVASDAILADLITISTENLDDTTPTVISSSQTDGIYSLVLEDLKMNATGTVGPFRYVVLYNDTATDDDLICWFDYGSEITLSNGESFTLDFGTSLFTLA